MAMCTKSLLNDPLPILQIGSRFNGVNGSCLESLRNVNKVQSKYWKSLRFDKKLPDYDVIELDETEQVLDGLDKLNLSEKCKTRTMADSSAGNENSKSPSTSNSNEPQPGPSSSAPKIQTLTDYLAENKDVSVEDFTRKDKIRMKFHLQALINEEMFAVVPLSNCPHLTLLKPEEAPSSIDTKRPCKECDTSIENWICLICFETYCARFINQHMIEHNLNTDHPLALSFSDLSVWCYKCEAYIDNPRLHKFKDLAHLNKFGEHLVWSHGTEPTHFHIDLTTDE